MTTKMDAGVQARVSLGPLDDRPQTCGGLLATIPETQIDDVLKEFAHLDEPIWTIGCIEAGSPIINVRDL